ncbi:SURF1 family protein [Gymnodinialimonas sp. 2305UL16-5]|uniref:SURF1 family protein n=1 Tax=Gymnodinialimonas mytili TaxID=3126503 RepID=UPI0030B0B088
MTRRLIIVVLFGLIGAGILAGLGFWQLQRLSWKEGVLAEIDTRITAAPVAIPGDPDPEADRYLPVSAEGAFVGDPVRVLVSLQGSGPGYRLIQAFDLGERRVMVDRGFLAERAEAPDLAGPALVIGNLHWPDEVDGFTPDADLGRNIWYARDVDALAAHLGADPILIIARSLSVDDSPVTPLPVSSDGIPNNHLGYAVQWFGLALVWLGMTAFLGWRITRRTA